SRASAPPRNQPTGLPAAQSRGQPGPVRKRAPYGRVPRPQRGVSGLASKKPAHRRAEGAAELNQFAEGAEGRFVAYSGDEERGDRRVQPQLEALLDPADRAEQRDGVGELVRHRLDRLVPPPGQEQVLDLRGRVGVAEAADQVEVEVAL